MRRPAARLPRPLAALACALALAGALAPAGCGRHEDPARAIVPNADRDPSLRDAELPGADHGVTVLCYHYFSDHTAPVRALRAAGAVLLGLPLVNDVETWTTPAGQFERQLRFLAEHDYRSLGLDELLAIAEGRTPLPERAVVLTFDDGDRSVYTIAWPLLKKYGFKGVLFIVDGWVDGGAPPELNVMSWAEIRELAASGDFEVQSHSHSLHYKTWHEDAYYAVAEVVDWQGDPAGLERLAADLRRSRSTLAEHLGEAPRYLAWPYGSATARTDSIARAAGFAGSFGLRFGRVGYEEQSPMSLPRYAITARTTPTFFARLLSGD